MYSTISCYQLQLQFIYQSSSLFYSPIIYIYIYLSSILLYVSNFIYMCTKHQYTCIFLFIQLFLYTFLLPLPVPHKEEIKNKNLHLLHYTTLQPNTIQRGKNKTLLNNYELQITNEIPFATKNSTSSSSWWRKASINTMIIMQQNLHNNYLNYRNQSLVQLSVTITDSFTNIDTITRLNDISKVFEKNTNTIHARGRNQN